MSNLFFAEDVLFDSHCHLNDSAFDADRDEVVQGAVAAGVDRIVDVAESVASSHRALENAKKYPGIVYASIGIDPHAFIPKNDEYYDPELQDESKLQTAFDEIRLMVDINRRSIAALGETGLDNYWYQELQKQEKLSQPLASKLFQLQEKLYRWHLELSAETGLPLTVHSRAAEQRSLEIAKDYPAARGVFHSYTGDYETAKGVLDVGWGLGVNGIITFNKSQQLREVFKKILGEVSSDWSPADFYQKGIYFETDAPYLAPEPHRGERNEPEWITILLDQVGKL